MLLYKQLRKQVLAQNGTERVRQLYHYRCMMATGVRPSDGMPFGDECKGHWVFTASSKNPPQIVDLGLNPIINQSEVYSGIYARVSINFFAYNTNGKKGIGCGLGNVQKVEDGEPLGGRTNAGDDFADSTQQYGAQAPQQYQPAAQYGPQVQYGAQAPSQQAINPITGLAISAMKHLSIDIETF